MLRIQILSLLKIKAKRLHAFLDLCVIWKQAKGKADRANRNLARHGLAIDLGTCCKEGKQVGLWKEHIHVTRMDGTILGSLLEGECPDLPSSVQ